MSTREVTLKLGVSAPGNIAGGVKTLADEMKRADVAGKGMGLSTRDLARQMQTLPATFNRTAAVAGESLSKISSGLMLLGTRADGTASKTAMLFMEMHAGLGIVQGLTRSVGDLGGALGSYTLEAARAAHMTGAFGRLGGMLSSRGGRIALGGIGAGIGAYAGSQFSDSPYAPYVGGAIGAGAGFLAPKAIGAAAGGVQSAAAAGGVGGAFGALPLAIAAAVATAFTIAFDRLMNKNWAWEAAGDTWRASKAANNAVKLQNRYVDREEFRAPIIAAEFAGREQIRAGQFAYRSMALQPSLDYEAFRRSTYLEGEFANRAGKLMPGRAPGEAEFQYQERVRQFRDSARGLAGTTGKSQAEAERAAREADIEALRATEDRLAKQKELASVIGVQGHSIAEEVALRDQLAGATARVLQAEEKRIEAIRNQGRVAVENQTQWKQFAADQEKFYQAQAFAERERQKGLKETFATMDPIERQGTLGISRKLAQGQRLTREEQDFAQANPLLQEKMRQVAVDQLGSGGNQQFNEILRNTGRTQALQDAERNAKNFADVRIATEQKIAISIENNAKSMANEIAEAVAPKLLQQKAEILAAVTASLIKNDAAKKAEESSFFGGLWAGLSPF